MLTIQSYRSTQCDNHIEVHNATQRLYYRFHWLFLYRFLWVTQYILFGKNLLYYLKYFIYFIFYITTISFYIFDNTLILLIRPLNTTIRQLKDQSYRINLNRQIFTYRSFSITY
jgi:hypothetical protein